MDKKRIVNNFLIISCTGKNDKIGLKIDNNFFIHDIQTKIYNNDTLVDKILDLVNKNKANIDENFSVIVNNGPGKFSSIRAALAVAKGIQISSNVKLYGYKAGTWGPKKCDDLFRNENTWRYPCKNLVNDGEICEL